MHVQSSMCVCGFFCVFVWACLQLLLSLSGDVLSMGSIYVVCVIDCVFVQHARASAMAVLCV